MDEEELKEMANALSDYCIEHEYVCDGCIFYREITFGKSRKGKCVLNTMPEQWRRYIDN